MTDNTVSTMAGEASAVRAVLEGIFAAWKANDADDFAAWYAEDATVVLPSVYMKDRDAIRANMEAAFDGPLKGSSRAVDVLSVRFLGRDAAVVVGTSAVVPKGEGRPPAEQWSLATWVLSKHDEKWLVEAYHECPLPLPSRTEDQVPEQPPGQSMEWSRS
jgi:uncharacterized protein (TIGR02246 family)